MKEVSGDEKSELNKKVQVEVKTLKGLKDSTAAAQEKCASYLLSMHDSCSRMCSYYDTRRMYGYSGLIMEHVNFRECFESCAGLVWWGG